MQLGERFGDASHFVFKVVHCVVPVFLPTMLHTNENAKIYFFIVLVLPGNFIFDERMLLEPPVCKITSPCKPARDP